MGDAKYLYTSGVKGDVFSTFRRLTWSDDTGEAGSGRVRLVIRRWTSISVDGVGDVDSWRVFLGNFLLER